MTTMTPSQKAHLAHLHEERDWYAVAIANAVAAGRSPRVEDVTAYRDARDALNAQIGIRSCQ